MTYHPSLTAEGLAPSSTFKDIQEGVGTHDWNRLWIVINNVEVKTMTQGDLKLIEIGDITMKVEAR